MRRRIWWALAVGLAGCSQSEGATLMSECSPGDTVRVPVEVATQPPTHDSLTVICPASPDIEITDSTRWQVRIIIKRPGT